ncbi:adenylyltransferase/cytidyltransferase family protein [bacterium]|nr:adenylyltransferase/cytidyltransferase family protein [candidate division CSSED10-310 bacterium]
MNDCGNIETAPFVPLVEALGKKAAQWREEGLAVVLCHGCFDPFHPGHLVHFREAKRLGDRLIVTITHDYHVRRQKGPPRPFFSHDLRLAVIAEMRLVDGAAISPWSTAVEVLEIIRPGLYVKGADYLVPHKNSEALRREMATLERHGGRMAYTGGLHFSSTRIMHEAWRSSPGPGNDGGE